MTGYKLFVRVIAFWLFSVTTVFGQAGNCKVTGNIGGNPTGNVKMEAIIFGKPVAFESVLQNGAFEISVNQPSPTAYRISLTQKPEAGMATLFCDNNQVKFQALEGNLEKAIVTGSNSHDEWKDYNTGITSFDSQLRAVQEYFEELAMKGEMGGKEDSLRFTYQSLSQGKENYIQSWILNHTGSYVSPFILAVQYGSSPRIEILKPLFEPLKSEIKDSYYGRVMGEVVTKLDALSIGKTAPAFSQSDPDGKMINLESFRGKYVLLDFWASWCGPCRQENPNLVRTYQKFQDKLSILGISLDQKKDPWLKAIKDDQLTWPQVSDLKFWNNAVAELYQVRSIPANYLLDKEGKIIAKNLRGPDLERALEQLLK